jgi:hypothetical protein
VIELFDNDVSYSFSDYLGYAALPVNSTDGRHTLTVLQG